jgi:hypothetical protein
MTVRQYRQSGRGERRASGTGYSIDDAAGERMRFRISRHSGRGSSTRPADAVDRLWQRLGTSHDQASFGKVGSEIWATWGVDVPTSMEQDERAEIGRRVVLDIVRDVCERSPELEFDWFSVGFDR